jgi:hypothetical protein
LFLSFFPFLRQKTRRDHRPGWWWFWVLIQFTLVVSPPKTTELSIGVQTGAAKIIPSPAPAIELRSDRQWEGPVCQRGGELG